jgi:hypothetical protein
MENDTMENGMNEINAMMNLDYTVFNSDIKE